MNSHKEVWTTHSMLQGHSMDVLGKTRMQIYNILLFSSFFSNLQQNYLIEKREILYKLIMIFFINMTKDLDFSPRNILASASIDNRILLWDLNNARVLLY